MKSSIDQCVEVNFDGLVGPTHYYGGLSYGNVASMEHGLQCSSPKRAALEGLEKMKLLHELGIPQGILPPHERPFLAALRAFGFQGNDTSILEQAWKKHPLLLMACSSASSMWAANAATVTPSCDSSDGKVHLTVANLQNRLHRSIEPATTLATLRHIFHDARYFTVHPPLPSGGDIGDEGGANHIRFCKTYGKLGVHLFVYGKSAFEGTTLSHRFPPRQCLEASQAIVRCHGISDNQVVFAKQHPMAIDAGVFHNDVISTGDQSYFFYHEYAFEESKTVMHSLKEKVKQVCGKPLVAVQIKENQLSLSQAVKTYFFNSQIVTRPNGEKVWIAPEECACVPFEFPFPVLFVNLRQSMENGGGPACLRLRVVLNEQELLTIPPSMLFSQSVYGQLKRWIEKHFRDKLTPRDLADPDLLNESREALDALTHLLKMGSFYSFQKEDSD